MSNILNKKTLEELTRKGIVATPFGFYKIMNIEKIFVNNYILKFVDCDSEGCVRGNEEKFELRSNFKFSFSGGDEWPFSVLDLYDRDSYKEENETDMGMKIFVKGTGKGKMLEPYIKNFLINYSKLMQNFVNEAKGESERYKIDFLILKQK